MRLLLIVGSYPPMKCGVGAYTQRLAAALAAASEIVVTVLTDIRADAAIKSDAVEVLPVARGWALLDIFRIAKTVREVDPDIVHIQFPTQGFSGKAMPRFLPLLMWALGKPCLQTWHEPIRGLSGLLLTVGLKTLVSVRENLLSNLPRLTRFALKSTRFLWIPGASLLPVANISGEEKTVIRDRYVIGDESLLVYYGFLAPLKGVENLIQITAQMNLRLLMICDLHDDNAYHQTIRDKINSMDVSSRVTVTGYLPDGELAKILAAADAVVLPFKDGAGPWNSSIDGAVAQGTFVLTTSTTRNGYDPGKNTYYATPGAVDEMAAAIRKYAGNREPPRMSSQKWDDIVSRHVSLYRDLIGTSC